ncbi:MAG TPA: ferredoxin [Polyangia bacterium]|nr:ferredoxin [Polyangia bacterium]
MAYVITRLCRDCVDTSCVSVCPEPECIVEHRPLEGVSALPNQLFINPDQCICCSACQPECPWEAIFDEDEVPAAFAADITLNAISGMRPEEFVQAGIHTKPAPSADEVEANKRRWQT